MKNIFSSINMMVFNILLVIFVVVSFIFFSTSQTTEIKIAYIGFVISLIIIFATTVSATSMDGKEYNKETKELIEEFKSINTALAEQEIRINKIELKIKDLTLQNYKNMDSFKFLTFMKNNFENNLPDIEYWDEFEKILIDRVLSKDFDNYVDKSLFPYTRRYEKRKINLEIEVDKFKIWFYVYKGKLILSIGSSIGNDVDDYAKDVELKSYYKVFDDCNLLDKIYNKVNKLVGEDNHEKY